MTALLIRLFIKNHSNTANAAVRGQYGKLAGVIGIAGNLLLFGVKLLAGLLSGSISIMADAVNNLSDGAASLITLAAFRLSERPADEDHPYGHARYEYISGVIVSCMILVIGFQFLVSSVQRIHAPQTVQYSAPFWIIAGVSMLVKLWLRFFNTKMGRSIDSAALFAAAADSRNDVIITGVVLLSALISHFTGFAADGYMGAAVALFLLYSGVGLIRQTLSPLLGEAPEEALVTEIEQKILGYPSVIGLHDLMVHDYGPARRFASVHVEMPAGQDILLSHDIIDNIERDFAADLKLSLVVHLDPVITDDPILNEWKNRVADIVQAISPQLSIHDFRMVQGVSHSNLIFDLVVPPKLERKNGSLREEISAAVQAIDKDYFCVITVDRSYVKSVQKG